MRLKNIIYRGYILLSLGYFSFLNVNCNKDGRIDYFDSNTPAPAVIKDVKVINTAGGAILTYVIPNDRNFYYAKAVYEIQPNVFKEAKSSLYNDTLRLEGFGDTAMHEVKVFSVGRNEKESSPVTVKVQPRTPGVIRAFLSIKVAATFGGVQVSFHNASKDNLAIVIMKDTTKSQTWSTLETFHTGADSGRFTVRGLDSIKQDFAVFVRDRWNNKSDTLKLALKPIFEQAISKDTWQAMNLPTDQTEVAENYVITRLWDGKFPTLSDSYASSNSSVLPQWFTIDLGKKVIMSRIAEHQTSASFHFYDGSALKAVEIWGSNNPDADGGWTHWDSLGTFHSFKPSGLPMGQTNGDDAQYGQIMGEDFAFDHLLPAYRYIRWKTLETYSSPGQVVISEIDIYGQIEK